MFIISWVWPHLWASKTMLQNTLGSIASAEVHMLTSLLQRLLPIMIEDSHCIVLLSYQVAYATWQVLNGSDTVISVQCPDIEARWSTRGCGKARSWGFPRSRFAKTEIYNLYHIPWTWCSYVRFNMWLHFVLILFHSASPVSRQHRQQVQAIRHASLKIRNRGPGIAVKEVNIYRVHTVHPSLFLRTTPWQWEACISWSLKLSSLLLVQKPVSWKTVIHTCTYIYIYIIHILFMSTSQSGLRQCFVMLDWLSFWFPRSACVATFLLPSGKCQ